MQFPQKSCRRWHRLERIEWIIKSHFGRRGRHELRDALGAHPAHFKGLKSAFLPEQAGKERYRNIARFRRLSESVAKILFRCRRGGFDFRNRLAVNRRAIRFHRMSRSLGADRMSCRLDPIFLSSLSRRYRECASRHSMKTMVEFEAFEIECHRRKRNNGSDEKSHL